jgi:hypothetical protein
MGNTLGGGGTEFEYKCAPGRHVKHISGGSDTNLTGIKVMCSDGSESPYFGNEGSPWSLSNEKGFKDYGGFTGSSSVNALHMQLSDGSWTTLRGTQSGSESGGGPNGATSFWTGACKPGKVITGVRGGKSTRLHSLSFYCGQSGDTVVKVTPPPIIIPPPGPITHRAVSSSQSELRAAKTKTEEAAKRLKEAHVMIENAEAEEVKAAQTNALLKAKADAEAKLQSDKQDASQNATDDTTRERLLLDAAKARTASTKATADALAASIILADAKSIVRKSKDIKSQAIIDLEIATANEDSAVRQANVIEDAAIKHGVVESPFIGSMLMWLIVFIVLVMIFIAMFMSGRSPPPTIVSNE